MDSLVKIQEPLAFDEACTIENPYTAIPTSDTSGDPPQGLENALYLIREHLKIRVAGTGHPLSWFVPKATDEDGLRKRKARVSGLHEL